MLVIFKNLPEKIVNTYVTVLAASGIIYTVGKADSGWDISIQAQDEQKAFNAIEQYIEENQHGNLSDNELPFNYYKTRTGLLVALILLIFHVAVIMIFDSRVVIRNYGSSASHVIEGEHYRTVTSLFLHGDVLHLVGNMLGIALFGTAVCSIAGWGAGWLIIFFTGMFGNLINAYFYQTGHLSIGASTAVFGSIGFLSAYQFMEKIRMPGQKFRAWVSIAGGIALLGILGSSEFTDIMAHFFGFAVGIIIGSFYRSLLYHPISSAYQRLCLIIVLGLLIIPWIIGPGFR